MTSGLGGLRGGVEEQEPFWPCTTEVRRTGGERSLEGRCDCRLDVLSWRCQSDALETSRSGWRQQSGAQNSRDEFRALCSEMGLKPARLGKVTDTEFKPRTESPRLVLSTPVFTVWWWRHFGTKKKHTREKPAAQMVNQGKHCFLWVWDDTFLC